MNRSLVAGMLAIITCLAAFRLHAQQLQAPVAADLTQRACVAIGQLRLPELLTIDSRWVNPGPPEADIDLGSTGAISELPGHCRVQGVIAPAIRFELWLPEPGAWNARFLAVGSPALGTSINHAGLLDALQRGYATASNNAGHTASDYNWLNDPALLRDVAYRASFEMSDKAEAIIARFYGRGADYSYFNGCSLAGHQGLMQAGHFPDSYDGIIAGAPFTDFIAAQTLQLWNAGAAQSVGTDSLLNRNVLNLISESAIEQCDAIDGVRDGVLEDPRRCNLDPARLQCGLNSGSSACLSASQVAAARSIYAGPLITGEQVLSLHGLAMGSEREWSVVAGASPPNLAVEFFRRAVLADPSWDWRRFDPAADHALAEAELGWMLQADPASLARYRDQGGKLILYQGWNDTENSPESTIAYYEELERTLASQANPGSPATRDFARLFMVPGMAHCSGGVGTDQFDAQRAIEDWVERDIPPARIEASRTQGNTVLRTRPLCPYPEIARFRGTGDTDRSGSFVCDF